MTGSEPVYTAGEAAKLAQLLARGAWQAQRGKSTAAISRKVDQLKEAARRREALEAAARRKVADQRAQKKAEQRAARRFW